MFGYRWPRWVRVCLRANLKNWTWTALPANIHSITPPFVIIALAPNLLKVEGLKPLLLTAVAFDLTSTGNDWIGLEMMTIDQLEMIVLNWK